MSVKGAFGFLIVNFTNDVLDNGFRLIVGNRPGLGSRYVGGIADDLNIICVFGF